MEEEEGLYLPPEVVVHIVSFLPLEDRLTTRLVWRCVTLCECFRDLPQKRREWLRKTACKGAERFFFALQYCQKWDMLQYSMYHHVHWTEPIFAEEPVEVYKIHWDKQSPVLMHKWLTKILVYIHEEMGVTVDELRLYTQCQLYLLVAIKYRDFTALSYLKQIGFTGDDLAKCAYRAFRDCIHDGSWDVFQYLVVEFPFGFDALPQADWEDVFRDVIQSQKWDVLVTLQQQFQVTRDMFPVEYLLRLAAANGDIEVMRYVYEAFQLTPDDARAHDCAALTVCAQMGKLRELQFLCETVGLGAEDVRVRQCCAVRFSTMCGHLDTLRYLCDTFQFTAEEVLYQDTFMDAAEGGHLDVLRFLRERFDVSSWSDRSASNALCENAEKGRLDVLKYLIEEIGVKLLYSKPLTKSIKGNHVDVAKYLLHMNPPKKDVFGFSIYLRHEKVGRLTPEMRAFVKNRLGMVARDSFLEFDY